MAVTGYKIYLNGARFLIDEVVDSGEAIQMEGNAWEVLPTWKYVDSDTVFFKNVNSLTEKVTKEGIAFDEIDLDDAPYSDLATFKTWLNENVGKSSGGDAPINPTDLISDDADNALGLGSDDKLFVTGGGGGALSRQVKVSADNPYVAIETDKDVHLFLTAAEEIQIDSDDFVDNDELIVTSSVSPISISFTNEDGAEDPQGTFVIKPYETVGIKRMVDGAWVVLRSNAVDLETMVDSGKSTAQSDTYTLEIGKEIVPGVSQTLFRHQGDGSVLPVGYYVEVKINPEEGLNISAGFGGSEGEYAQLYLTPNGGTITINGRLKFNSLTAPSSASDSGQQGEVRFSDDYIYYCIADNTWVRAALETWI